MKLPAALLVVLLGITGAQAQEVPDQPQGCAPVEERVGRPRRHPRIIVVVDTSGSMSGPKIAAATHHALEIICQPTDGLDVAVILFNDGVRRLVPDPDDPWYHLPDAQAAGALRGALTMIHGSGETHPGPALTEALNAEADTVILLTDGEFSSDPTGAVQAAQEDGGPRLVLFAIGASQRGREALQQLADDTGALIWE